MASQWTVRDGLQDAAGLVAGPQPRRRQRSRAGEYHQRQVDSAYALHSVLKAGRDDRINHAKACAEHRGRTQRLLPLCLELIEVVIATGGGTWRNRRHRSLPRIKDMLSAVQQIEAL